jgi:Zn-dependent metalloprotease
MKLRKSILAAAIAALPLAYAGAQERGLLPEQMMAAPAQALSADAKAMLVDKLNSRRSAAGLDSDHGFKLKEQHPGANGTRVTRADHTFQGLRVFGSESVVVTDDSGDIISESVSDRRQGLDASRAAKAGGKGAPDTTPALSVEQAIAVAVQSSAPVGTHRWKPEAELLVWPVMKTVRVAAAVNKAENKLNAMDLEDVVDHYELAYLVKTRMAQNKKMVYRDTVVSAKSGTIIKQWDALQSVVGTGHSQYNGDVPIQTTLSGSTYKMLDATRGTGGSFGGMAITNANHSPESNPQPGTIYTNSTNVWGDGAQYISGGSTTNANGQTAAVNALWGLMNTYDTMKNVLGWSSLDGNNTATYIAVHVDNNYDNAFFDPGCKCMYIGDGSSFYSLGSIDVIGHEMGHGVTDATSNLTYSGESGGLNESNSDISGEMTEAYARNGGTGSVIPAGNDWMMGKEIARNGVPLRWMWKPSKDGSSKDAWSSSLGGLNVHYSSGPNNRMFYFLSQGSNASSSSEMYSSYLNKQPLAMTGIGNDKAFRIWFKANTTKFTASTNYADARNKVVQAAEELYGVGSKESIAVKRAYAAINVGADVDETTVPPGSVTITTQPNSVTVAAGATASFTVGASGGTTPYTYKWYRNGAVIAGATSPTYSLTAQASDNGAVFNAVVSDSSSPVKTATSNNATLSVGTTLPVERVANGGFESGTSPWAGTTGVIGNYSGQTAYEGTRFAWLGGNGTTATETITQDVVIPATATSANLSFALHIDTAESGSTVYDKLTVAVKSTSGATLGTLATYSNVNKAAGYQIRTFNLLPYKGQTVRLSFSMTEDSSLQTSFVVDKVSLITQ